ncbi:hypothetical protein B9G39_00215 [Zooshikella ganghwensis]|uniref:Uncharacterized protein n=1 Tax=Zooshikella ganghwensis TaxID=202772 RepID=A0A4P9VG22_9GAMM|nr:hypothetical protein B9G39_00215 [Zooshikella ganghwensis]
MLGEVQMIGKDKNRKRETQELIIFILFIARVVFRLWVSMRTETIFPKILIQSKPRNTGLPQMHRYVHITIDRDALFQGLLLAASYLKGLSSSHTLLLSQGCLKASSPQLGDQPPSHIQGMNTFSSAHSAYEARRFHDQ